MAIKNILVAFDGSPNSSRAFRFALDLAKAAKGEEKVHVISVVKPPEPAEMVMRDMEPIIEFGTKHYEGLFGKLRAMAGELGIQLETQVPVGYPADQIIQYAIAQKCELIVMGRLGNSKIERWLLGSVAKQVSFHAPCAVTIVP